MPEIHLKRAVTDADYRSTFDVMRELRPHLTDVDAFVRQMHRQAEQDYVLLTARHGSPDGAVVALAGYRHLETRCTGASSMSTPGRDRTRAQSTAGRAAARCGARRRAATRLPAAGTRYRGFSNARAQRSISARAAVPRRAFQSVTTGALMNNLLLSMPVRMAVIRWAHALRTKPSRNGGRPAPMRGSCRAASVNPDCLRYRPTMRMRWSRGSRIPIPYWRTPNN